MRLADIVLLKKHLAHQGIGNCPKKAVFYDFKQPKLEAAAFHGLS
jgi:hypothetical protein